MSDKNLSKRAEKPRLAMLIEEDERTLGGVAPPKGCFNHLVVVFAAEFFFSEAAKFLSKGF